VETTLSYLIVVTYAAVLTFVALRARAARKFSEFSLAGRKLPLALVFGSLAATYVGPGFSIGFVGKGFNSGFLFLAIGMAYALQNILVGLLVTPRLRALKNCCTVGDAIGRKYDKKCHILAGIISVSVCTFLAAVMAHAGGVILNDIFGIQKFSAAMAIVAITALYTTFGGLRASVITDAFQFTAFAVLLPTALLCIMAFGPGADAAGFAREASAATGAGFKSLSTIEIVGLLAAFLLGETLIPPYANRALASKTTSVARNGFILAGCFSMLWFTVMIALGITARSIVPSTTGQDHVLLNLVRSTMPLGSYALLAVVLVSVVMSSLDSLLNAGAVAFTQDIFKPLAKFDVPEALALNVGRWATVIVGIIAAVVASAVAGIIEGLLICYTIWAAAILPSLIGGLWIKRPSPLAGMLSMTVGIIVAVIAIVLLFIKSPVAVDIPAIIIPALAATVSAYIVGHWIAAGKQRRIK